MQSQPQDHHFPLVAFDNPLRKLFGRADRFNQYVQPGQTAADLGCGPGYYTFALAEAVGAQGKVYAVDADSAAASAVERKALRLGCAQIEAHCSSAAQLDFIPTASVDFILADGLLCCMAPAGHAAALSEFKRIMRPQARAYISAARGRISYVDDTEWEEMLRGFAVENRNYARRLQGRWAVVRLA